ncbi:MAG: [Fe-Fe] hydrogenase large subunit C-terminal domain-containing protein [Thermoleophilia bacterium]|jgi:iron-only hydrogenase group A
MTIIINNRELHFEPGETVLQVAERAGIHIPHLCYLDWAPSPSASCRLCIVEVEGVARLQTSCTLLATDGLVVNTHTPRILRARRAIVELLVANHPQDCLACNRSGSCELSELSRELGVRPRHYVGMKKDQSLDISSAAIWRDPNKCVLCGRCVTVCHHVQGVGAIDFIGRGFRTKVGPGFHAGLNVSGCVYCGQCVKVCPTGALMEHSHVEAVTAALGDTDTVVVAQVAPAIPATLAKGRGKGQTIPDTLARLSAALKSIGFAAVFDTGFAADVTIMEEANELVKRLQDGGTLPMFTSCSPAWITYVETHRPDLIPHLSTCKSPQQMAGALIKEIYPRYADLDGRRLVVVAIMPCTAKKFEAQDLGDVDYVLTTRELDSLWSRFGLNFDAYEDQAPLDPPFAEATGAARLFGGTGGVMEAAVRTAATLVGAEPPSGPLTEARGPDGVKRFTLKAGDLTLNMSVVNGLGRLSSVLDDSLNDLHFIEVMSCPGGCAEGGGQPYQSEIEEVHHRIERIHEADERAETRYSHENTSVAALYEKYLGHPLSEVSHKLLHREYVDRNAEERPPVVDEPAVTIVPANDTSASIAG